MRKIRSPYNFVPLNKHVLIPDWGNVVSQDIPFEDAQDGTIEITLHNTTPLYVKNEMKKDSADDNLSAHVIDAEGNKLYYLPGSSLKGMLRAVVEIISFGRMDRYNKDYFGYREFDTKSPVGKKYKEMMENVRCGWLIRREDEFYVEDCGTPRRVRIEELKHNCPMMRINKEKSDIYVSKEVFTLVDKNHIEDDRGQRLTICEDDHRQPMDIVPVGTEFVLVPSGDMEGKKHEHIFPKYKGYKDNDTSKVDPEVIKHFLSIYKPSPTYTCLYDRMYKKSEPIPIFFIEKEGKVVNMGLNHFFRFPYINGVEDCVRQETAPKDDNMPDMAQCMFGRISNRQDGYSLKGRIQACNAFAERIIEDRELTIRSGVLRQPRASYYPLYVRQASQASQANAFNTYDTAGIEIAGRKRYRIHSDTAITEIPGGNNNDNVTYLLPANVSFRCQIHIHNLRKIEVGALLSALTFHNTPECYHNIGMGKSFGYGKLKIDNVMLTDGLALSVEEYMQAFEMYMNLFTRTHCKKLWHDTEQVKQLFAIAMEHTSKEELMMMELTEYGNYKTNDKASSAQLIESPVNVKPLVSPLAIAKDTHKGLYEQARLLEEQGKYYEAWKQWEAIEKAISPETDPEIDDNMKRLLELINKKPAPDQKGQQRSITDELNRKLENGEFAIKRFDVAAKKINHILKTENRDKLNEEEIIALEEALKRYKDATTKRDMKIWEKESKIWIQVKEWTDEDTMERLFKAIW